MKREKDIGELIAERLSQSEVEQPSNLIWKTIEKTLIRRRRIRIGLVSMVTITVLTSISFFLILPSIQEKTNKNPTLPKVSKASKNDFPKNNNGKPITKKDNGKQTPVDHNVFEDSIDQNLIERDVHYRKSPIKHNKPRKNLKAANGQEHFQKLKFAETSANPTGKSNSSKTQVEHVTTKLGELGSENKKNDLSIIKTDSKHLSENQKEIEDTVQQDNPNVVHESWRFNDKIALKQGEDKNVEYPNSIIKSDSLTSKRIDSVRSKKSRKTSKTNGKLKKNVVDSIGNGKQFDLEYFFLPLINTSLYGKLKDKSTIDARLDGNKKTANPRFGFGGYGLVRINSKLEIRLGILYSNYSKETFDVDITPNDNSTNYYTNVNFKNGLNYGSFSNSFSQPSQITLQEELAYLEFPVDLSYSVWERNKWSIDLIAGASTAILVENRLNALTETGERINLGENGNYAKNTLNIRLGTGVYYSFSDYMALRLEILSKPAFGTFQTSETDRPILLNTNFGIAIRL